MTYRMLDYWHRQGWVTASCTEQVGATRSIRRYDDAAVLRLGAMRHLAQSRLDVARFGPEVGLVDLTGPVVMIIGSQPDATVEVVPSEELRQSVARPGRWVVFDPQSLKTRLGEGTAERVDDESSGIESSARPRWSA